MKKGVRAIFDGGRNADSRRQENSSDPFVGFSLLEVVLALAILAGALAALGEVMRLGDENAAAAADESRAEMLAESVMAEILVGARAIGNVSGAALPLKDDPSWTMSIEVQPTDYQELVAVRVSVAQQLDPQQQPARCDLVRWLPNPDFLPAETQESSQQSSSSTTGAETDGGSGDTGGQR